MNSPEMIATLDSGLITLLAVLCLVVISVSMLRRAQQRPARSRELTREQLARLRDQREVKDSMDELLVQLEDFSRRINAQVDTRFAKLEALIRDADDRIAKLGRLGQRSGGSEAAKSGPGGAVGGGAADRSDEFEPGIVGVVAPADGGVNDAAGNGESAEARAEESTPRVPRTREERFQRIYDLADSGSSAMAIADALQIPLGEVELILGLRKF